jgi:hypothetical protein
MRTLLMGAAAALALAVLASPGMAQTEQTAQEKAIHECSVMASKQHKDYTDEANKLTAFRACMGNHGFQGGGAGQR